MSGATDVTQGLETVKGTWKKNGWNKGIILILPLGMQTQSM